ncbi:hypothetical protein KTS45_02475 [Halomicroarcula limicola]|uniref:Phosphoenolpyruvate synthase n=1 Tax=Haloarcula limicola TaxID=1429915 RepID=A0A8J8C3G8_9EURY|nr:PEP/pyruvate-binding domain-containing protein [Halomicroarcula limicola]MBV0923054.1 hypothetical protein [Halomicroarcula limicola]
MTDLVLPFDDPVAAEPSVSGGKGATLARLRALGFPVPDGVVVTTATYRLLADAPEITDRLDDLDAAVARGDDEARSAAAASLRDLLRERPLPAGAVDGLERHLLDGPSAVRSSATAEDLPGASFAGQYDSFLGVEGVDAVTTAVRDCMASLFTDRAVAYRARNDIAAADAAMAVVVQRFVEPDVSGILFTADPVNGSRTVSVVEAGPGRGDRQVSGRSTADSIRVGEDGTVLDYRIGPSREGPVLSDELRAALDDPRTLTGVDFAARRREFERHERLTAPSILTSDGEHPTPTTKATTGRLLGTGAAPGVAEGVVRVVTDPSETRLSRGEVLVAPYTDPGWTPLFPNAAAVVTEVGGRLTHGSLVAREYGIPAVVAVEDATTRLRSGDRVRVDGTRGVVERLE